MRTERTGGKFVAQSMRPSYGVSMTPKFYGFFPGFGPIERIRHSIEPQLTFNYVPRGNVSNEFLAANGDIAQGYLGNNQQSTISLGFATAFEAKMRPKEVGYRANDSGRRIPRVRCTRATGLGAGLHRWRRARKRSVAQGEAAVAHLHHARPTTSSAPASRPEDGTQQHHVRLHGAL